MSRFLTAEDLFMSNEYPDIDCLNHNKTILALLDKIRDTKQFGEDVFYRYNKSKCVDWIKERVLIAKNSKEMNRMNKE